MLGEAAYLLTGLPISVASFTILMTGLCVSISSIILLGLPWAIATLWVARGFARLERARIGALGFHLAPAAYHTRGRGIRSWLSVLRDTQSWLDVLHGIVVMPMSLLTCIVVFFWWLLAFFGLAYWWITVLFHPSGNTLFEALGPQADPVEVAVTTLFGALLFISAPTITHWATLLLVGVDRLLLGNEQVRRLQGRVDVLTASRAAAVEAEAASLQRLERDLHDGPQQRLVRLGLDLSAAERRLPNDPEAARVLLAEARMQTADALAELRALSRGIAPPILIDRGLAAALAAVAARCTVPADLHITLPDRPCLPAAVERCAYFVVSEALANVAKHSQASRVQIRVLCDRTVLHAEVEDNGIGGAHPAKGHGLAGLCDRLAAVDGVLIIDSPRGGPTRLIAEIPCGLS